eukprot:CAMPEP_0172842874 /NCGR_PEP_ID=MMETSP1075-20121228/31054_1 /TAXON_ID=2916 /ORGANISM="Ceratium fusus, Strain PA161109" /LENGTH=174 /DNA_ID=CAMNT_0013687061 /DNA_START=44 /DNA_END=565 /DNA_ORIENTATION=+
MAVIFPMTAQSLPIPPPRHKRRGKAKKAQAPAPSLSSTDHVPTIAPASSSARPSAGVVVEDFSTGPDTPGTATVGDEEQGILAAVSGEDNSDEDDDEDQDPEWNRLRHAVAERAEQISLSQPKLPLECMLLKALWDIEKQFPMDLVARYQVFVANGLAEDEEEVSEAQFWFNAQ